VLDLLKKYGHVRDLYTRVSLWRIQLAMAACVGSTSFAKILGFVYTCQSQARVAGWAAGRKQTMG
jgi:hypothetical protein